MKVIAGILGIFVTMPIWYYLLYKILQGVNATELTWFLYWAYVPIATLVNVLTKLTEE